MFNEFQRLFSSQYSQNFLLQYLYEVAWRCVILQWNIILLLNYHICLINLISSYIISFGKRKEILQ